MKSLWKRAGSLALTVALMCSVFSTLAPVYAAEHAQDDWLESLTSEMESTVQTETIVTEPICVTPTMAEIDYVATDTSETEALSEEAEIVTGECGDSVSYTLENGVLTVSGEGAISDYSSTYHPFTDMGITEVIIENGITAIGQYAFLNCKELTKVTMADTVTEIRHDAFRGCDQLSEVTLSAALETIGNYAFAGCSSLKEIVFSEGLKTIGNNAFEGCTALSFVKSSEDATYSIGAGAFQACTSLADVALKGNLTSLGSFAFAGCTALKTVTLGEGLTEIERCTFQYCTALETVRLPETLEKIGSEAFWQCANLTEIDFPDSLTTLGYMSFQGTGLTSVTLPAGLTKVEGQCFKNCGNLKTAVFLAEEAAVEYGVFNGCGALESVTLPRKVTGDLKEVFNGCGSLKTVNMPENMTAIGDSAFAYSGITELVIPEGVETISGSAFYHCEMLERITLPASLKYAASGMTNGCTALKRIDISDLSAWCNVETSTMMFANGASLYLNGELVEALVIPEGVTEIRQHTFAGCGSITSVTVPSTVTAIGKDAFSNCPKLKTVDLQTGIKTLGENAFYQCYALEDITFPEGLESIGNTAFLGCNGLTEITLPSTFTYLGSSVFNGCKALRYVTILDGLTAIGQSAFSGCEALESITLPATLETIGKGAFGGTHALKYIELPNGLKTIENEAFYFQRGLEEITIPGTVETIGDRAFDRCSALKKIVIEEGVTRLDASYIFRDCPNVEEFWIPSTMEHIDWDTFYNTYYKFTVYGTPATYAETYASEHGCPFVSTLLGESITLTVKDENGNEIGADKYTVQWYLDGTTGVVATGNTLHGALEGEIYYYVISLNEEMACIYKEPERKSMTVSADSLSQSVSLEKLSAVTVKGKALSADGKPFAGVPITFKQYFGNYEKEITVTADANGAYTAELLKVRTLWKVSADGYYEWNDILYLETEAASEISLEDAVMTEIETDRIVLSLQMKHTLADGEEERISSIGTFTNLTFVLRNKTKGMEIAGFVLQDPMILLREGEADAGDVVEITAVDVTGKMASVSAEVTLDEDRNGSLTLTFKENGKLTLDGLTGAEKSLVMIFDKDGKFVKSYLAEKSLTTDAMPDGEYTVVVMQKTDLLRGVSTLSMLDSFGLVKGTDYYSASVTLTGGKLSALSAITVPVLDENKLYYTVKENTRFTVNADTTVVGKYIIYRA
ncbi:MAG: leucine-rich repeat domain-containing protein, partial [Clostridia bacterium]|nr:leucine-rich repeat domain-containing protein [Clostridia bacterium]